MKWENKLPLRKKAPQKKPRNEKIQKGKREKSIERPVEEDKVKSALILAKAKLEKKRSPAGENTRLAKW